MGERDEMTNAEMRMDLAFTMYEGSNYSMEYCAAEIDRLTDTQIIAEWERQCENV